MTPPSVHSNGSSPLPLVEEIPGAPSPEEAFKRLCGLPFLLFLDSAATDEIQGRYSYLAACPFEVLRTSAGSTELLSCTGSGIESTTYESTGREPGDPFALLRRRLQKWAAPAVEGLQPFQGGAAGLFGYGLAHFVEDIPRPRHDEFEVPELAVGLYDWVLTWDHEKKTCRMISHGFPAEAAKRPQRAAGRIAEVKKLLLRTAGAGLQEDRRQPGLGREDLAQAWEVPEFPGLLSNFSRDDYTAAVARSIEYIRAGDIFQVNLSQRLACPAPGNSAAFYLALRKSNPAPYAGYFDLGEYVVASSSPEQFLSVSGDLVTTRPIKGTCSRGYTPEEDLSRRGSLGQSTKDQAENVMIVDLLRNDLSRVCRPHSVEVPALYEIERHPTVYHLVSEIRGRLREDCDCLDVLRASFPGGSITGAPKVRAMEIISELEPTARGPYCGSLAWLGFSGGMQSSILIRTATLGRGWLQMPVGGGIVSDSSPEAEYQETLQKATGMLPAIEECRVR